jgi:hypothetical protein
MWRFFTPLWRRNVTAWRYQPHEARLRRLEANMPFLAHSRVMRAVWSLTGFMGVTPAMDAAFKKTWRLPDDDACVVPDAGE